jgi:hypothetical protein
MLWGYYAKSYNHQKDRCDVHMISLHIKGLMVANICWCIPKQHLTYFNAIIAFSKCYYLCKLDFMYSLHGNFPPMSYDIN